MDNNSIHSIVNNEYKLLFEPEPDSVKTNVNIRTKVGKLIGTDLNSVHAKLTPAITTVNTTLWQNRIKRINHKELPALDLNIVDTHNLNTAESEPHSSHRTCKFYLFNCF